MPAKPRRPAGPPAVPVEPGQPVMILAGCNRKTSQPGTVTKIGRVWIEVTPDGQNFPHRFRLDDQTDGTRSGYADRFYTLDQWAERERREGAIEFLREQGVDLRWESPWRGREAELADVLRAHAAAQAGTSQGGAR